jgi:hypothetical protein
MTPSPVSASVGTIRLMREPRGRRDRLRAYSIVVDSHVVGTIRPAQTLDLPVARGTHSVQIAIDWARSPAIGVDVASGETVHLRCAPNTAQLGLYGATFGRKKYVRLWRAEGETDPAEERLPVPWLRFVMLAVLLAALGFAIAYGRTVDAAAVALLALVPASVIAAWAVARRRRSSPGRSGAPR